MGRKTEALALAKSLSPSVNSEQQNWRCFSVKLTLPFTQSKRKSTVVSPGLHHQTNRSSPVLNTSSSDHDLPGCSGKGFYLVIRGSGKSGPDCYFKFSFFTQESHRPHHNPLEEGDLEPPEISKQPIRTRYLGHVTGYRPIRDQYFLIRSVHA
eukprot:sb/3473378/